MKIIKKILIDATPMPSAKVLRSFTVHGDVGSVFSLTVTNEDSHFYNFSEILDKEGALETALGFAAAGASLPLKTIPNSGVYSGEIEFPAITDDDVYSIVITADSFNNTALDPTLSNNNTYVLPNIYKYLNTTVTFSLSSVSSSVSNLSVLKNVSISWPVTLSESQFVIARQLRITDFQFTTTSTSTTAGASTKTMEIDDVSSLSVGMGVAGTGVASGSVITAITPGYLDANKSSDLEDIYVIPKSIITDENGVVSVGDSVGGTITIDKSSSFDAAITVTFTGKGNSSSNAFNNTSFKINSALLTIDPVVTTTDAAVSNSATIPLTSTNGIKAADTVLMTGIGVTVASPHVDAISAGVNITASSAQTLENGQTMTFTGSSRSATITANITILEFGKDDITLTLALDNILTVA